MNKHNTNNYKMIESKNNMLNPNTYYWLTINVNQWATLTSKIMSARALRPNSRPMNNNTMPTIIRSPLPDEMRLRPWKIPLQKINISTVQYIWHQISKWLTVVRVDCICIFTWWYVCINNTNINRNKYTHIGNK